MDFLKKNKVPIGVVVVAVVGFVIYGLYFSGGSSGASLTSSDQASTVSQNLLVTLQNLNTIKLDPTVFSDPVFVSLTDFGVTIPPEAVGRPDPFAPLAGFGLKTGLTLPTGH